MLVEGRRRADEAEEAKKTLKERPRSSIVVIMARGQSIFFKPPFAVDELDVDVNVK